MIGPLVLLIALVLVGVSAAAITFLLRPRGRIDAAIMWAVVAVADVVGAMLLVGVPGLLRPGPLLAVHAVQALVPVTLLWRRGWPQVDVNALRPRLVLARAPWESAVVGLASLALGWQLVVALVLPPYAYDALSYHLVNVATWVQSANLTASPLNLCCAYYPGNAELLSAWSMVLLRHDALVGTVQVGAAALGGVAVAGIGRTAGLNRPGAAAAGALFVLTPAVLAQAPTSYVDVLQATFALCGLHGLGRFAATARPSHLVVTALCTGLIAGTKGVGLLWALALALSAVVIALVQVHRGRLRGLAAAGAMAGGLGACVLLSGWWYLRNVVETGSPLYPFELRVGSWTVFAGPVSLIDELTSQVGAPGRAWPVAVVRSWAADFFPWRHGSYNYEQRSGGLGPLWAWLGILVIPFLVYLWRRRSAALVAVAPILAVFLVQPWQWWARFTLPLAGVGAIAVVWSTRWFKAGLARRALQLAAIGLALLGAMLVVAEVNPASRAKPLPMSRVLGLVGASAEERSIGHLFFPEYRFLDQVPENATVMVDVGAEPIRWIYPLFGPRLQRQVLPGGSGPAPDAAWVVTSRGRPIDEQVGRSRPGPVFQERGIRVWAPRA